MSLSVIPSTFLLFLCRSRRIGCVLKRQEVRDQTRVLSGNNPLSVDMYRVYLRSIGDE